MEALSSSAADATAGLVGARQARGLGQVALGHGLGHLPDAVEGPDDRPGGRDRQHRRDEQRDHADPVEQEPGAVLGGILLLRQDIEPLLRGRLHGAGQVQDRRVRGTCLAPVDRLQGLLVVDELTRLEPRGDLLVPVEEVVPRGPEPRPGGSLVGVHG